MASFWLSHWNASEKVFVPEQTLTKLKPYHISIVRSLYRCLQKKSKGAILNYDEGINIPLAIEALLQALANANKIKLPVLVVGADTNLLAWHYHLSQISKVTILNSQNGEETFKNNNFSIILAKQSDFKLLQPYRENEFSFVIVENFDSMARKILFKRLSGEFNIALTQKDFMDDRDYKILWHILNWVNPGEFGKLLDFSKYDRDHLDNLRNPYDEIWYTFKHNVGDYDVDDKTENEKYEKTLADWGSEHNSPFSDSSTERKVRKRSATSPRKTNSKKLRKKSAKIVSQDETYDTAYHGAETQPVRDVVDEDEKNDSPKTKPESKGLRDVSDLNCSVLNNNNNNNNNQTSSRLLRKSDEQPAFAPFISQSKSVKRKSFEFAEDGSKSKSFCESSPTRNIDKSPLRNTSEHQYFPSLEDIFALKRKVNDTTQVTRPLRGAFSNSLVTNSLINSTPVKVKVPSLEEVFKCKRTFTRPNFPEKKQNIQEPQFLNRDTVNFPMPLLKNGKSTTVSADVTEKMNKVGNHFEEGINQKFSGSKERYTLVKMVNKETQTKDDCATKESTLNAQSSNKEYNSNTIKTISNNVEVSSQKINEDNKPKNAVRHSENVKNSNRSQDTDEDAPVLLSIMEGKLISSTNTDVNKQLTISDDIIDRPTDATKPNATKVLLESLFGDEIEDITDGKPVESILDEDNNFSDKILSNIIQLENNSQILKQLRVKTIDQINCEQSSQNSQDIYDSLKILFGNDCEINNSGKPNLISSLFG